MDREYEHVFIDLNIPRKREVIRDHLAESYNEPTLPPLFSLVEFNLSGLCNRTCVFCPRVDADIFPNVNEHIPFELYEKIVTELGALQYSGMVLFSGFGEPLLYKRIEPLIELTKLHCPSVRLESVTNGDQVTPRRLRSLFDAGLDALLISMYDGPEQVEIFQAMAREAGLSESQVVLRERWLPPEEHYGITLTNRAGMIDIPEVGISKLTKALTRRCFYPFYMVMVDYDGSVLLCTHDWGKKLIVGNLHHQSIAELWDGPIVRRARRNLAGADRGFPPCDQCDVDGTLIGQSHFDQWMDYYDRRPAQQR